MPHRDYEEFIASLNANRVRFLIVGAHALGFHARPRATKDLDIFYDPTPENCLRLFTAIRSFFGGASAGVAVEDLANPSNIIQLGVSPVRIDLLGSLSGIRDFESVWQRRIQAQYGDVEAGYLSLDDLIAAKTAAGRPQDKADLRVLRKVRRQGRTGGR